MEMRRLMDAERPAANPFDVKLAKGGLIDIEFLAQSDVLTGNGARQTSASEHFSRQAESPKQSVLLNASGFYQTVLQITRLCLDHPKALNTAPSGLIGLLLQHLELPDLKTAEASLKEMQKEVRRIFLDRMKNLA